MAAIEVLSETAREKSSYTVTVAFTDSAGAAATPSAVTWSLLDTDGAIVNSRDGVSATPGETVDIVLSGDDLVIGRKTLLIEATIDGRAEKENCYINVRDLHGV